MTAFGARFVRYGLETFGDAVAVTVPTHRRVEWENLQNAPDVRQA